MHFLFQEKLFVASVGFDEILLEVYHTFTRPATESPEKRPPFPDFSLKMVCLYILYGSILFGADGHNILCRSLDETNHPWYN